MDKPNPRDIWFRPVDPDSVPKKVLQAAEERLDYIRRDLKRPELQLVWCLPESKENALKEQQEAEDVLRHSDYLRYQMPMCFTLEALCYPGSSYIYVRADLELSEVVRWIARKAKLYDFDQNPSAYNWQDFFFDINAVMERYAAEAEGRYQGAVP